MRYLITGRNGQLAQTFIRRFEREGIEFLAPVESDFDITDVSRVMTVVEESRPSVIINCAAYNLVDQAENESEKAFAVNAEGPKILARAAQAHGSFFVHFSSDYVFDGMKENGLYRENDATNPLNEYGRSKLEGEHLVREESGESLVFRLSWVFGEGKQNFITKLAEWAEKSEYLKISCDEFSVPTYTDTVVDVTLKALDKGVTGLYHLTNSGFCSRYEWAKQILSSAGIKKFIRPVSMDVFNLPARRPKFSAMSNQLIADLSGVHIPTWEEAVSAFLHEKGSRHE
ncbi:MAG: dTDP-4-dehydrorhamnose reductase [Nitrospirota bacterium]|nr:dTDP-4-dehydrorhamnose reductase [Nitrospirota bacterium]